jgi:hypothetical protein
MNVPIVLEIKKYSFPETKIVDGNIQNRLCLHNQEIPDAVQIQNIQVIHITDVINVHHVDGVVVNQEYFTLCKKIPFGRILLSLMCGVFFCFIIMNTFTLFNLK